MLPKRFRCRGEGRYAKILSNACWTSILCLPTKDDLCIQRTISKGGPVSASVWYLESRKEGKLTSSQILGSSAEVSTGCLVVLCGVGTAGGGELDSWTLIARRKRCSGEQRDNGLPSEISWEKLQLLIVLWRGRNIQKKRSIMFSSIYQFSSAAFCLWVTSCNILLYA